MAQVLLQVHRSYLAGLSPLLAEETINGLAHVTGGGIPGNLPRTLPSGLGAVVDRRTWEVPSVFRVLQAAGGVEVGEMDRVFNMGVGMIAVVPPRFADDTVARLQAAGERAWVMGEVVTGEGVRFEG